MATLNILERLGLQARWSAIHIRGASERFRLSRGAVGIGTLILRADPKPVGTNLIRFLAFCLGIAALSAGPLDADAKARQIVLAPQSTATSGSKHSASSPGFAQFPDLRSRLLFEVPRPEVEINSTGDAVSIVEARQWWKTEPKLGDRVVSDLWVAVAPDWSPSRFLTVTSTDEEGDRPLQAQWNPDGRKLAIVSVGTSGYEIWIWDRIAQKISIRFDSECVVSSRALSVQWLNATRLVVLSPSTLCPQSPPHRAATAEPTTNISPIPCTGKPLTRAQVLQSGVPFPKSGFPQSCLVVLDSERRSAHEIGDGSFLDIQPSPDGGSIAALERVAFEAPREDQPLQHLADPFRHRVLLFDVRTNDTKVVPLEASNALDETLHWSPSSRAIAFLDFDWYSKAPPCVSAYSFEGNQIAHFCGAIGIQTQAIQAYLESRVRAREYFTWLGSDELVLRAFNEQAGNKSDWVVVKNGGLGQSVTQGLPEMPANFYSVGRQTFALSGRHLWEVHPGEPARDVTGFCNCLIETVREIAADGAGQIKLRASLAGSHAQVLLDLSEEKMIQKLDVPTGRWVQAVVMTAGRKTAVLESDNDLLLTTTSGEGSRSHETARKLIAWTTLAAKTVGTVTGFVYRTSDGRSLQARVTLPQDFTPGKRYPAIVVVYPGEDQPIPDKPTEVGPGRPDDGVWETASEYASKGYVVIEPSSPVDDEAGNQGRILDELSEDTVSAVNEAVRLGMVDSSRLGIVGHSAGGYMTLGILTRTNIFRAAVALAGPTDLASLYGTLSPSSVLDAGGEQYDLFRMSYNESTIPVPNQRTTPWAHPEIYDKNSPYTGADLIHTPVMIVQGEKDYVPVQQGEEMFSALFRLGRRAEFVRYPDDGHMYVDRYNVIDLMRRIDAWFAEFLAPSSPSNKPEN
jgi:dienelactone hydrolase